MSARRPDSLSLAQARRMALAAQGLYEPGKAVTGARNLRATFERLGAVQIDSVNVLVRSHYLPYFSRAGAYRRELLDEAAYGRRRALFEYWGHEASFLPLRLQPLMRWRMAKAARGLDTYKRIATFLREKADTVARVRNELAARGPVAASELGERGSGSWWGWSDTKVALEALFWTGEITTAYRRNFERVYDFTERVLPQAILQQPTPSPQDAQRALLLVAVRALGVATARDARDYYRLGVADARDRLAELVEDGQLRTVRVEGWKEAAYVLPGTRIPRTNGRSALLSPFDSLIWERTRTERLFGFSFRLEIYTPAAKRVHGYYVLPYLYDGRLVARLDVKSDRAASTLLVRGATLEPHAAGAEIEALRADVASLAAWLELDTVSYSGSAARLRPPAKRRSAR